MSAGSLVLQRKQGLSGCIYTLRLGGRRGVAGLPAFEISPLCLHTDQPEECFTKRSGFWHCFTGLMGSPESSLVGLGWLRRFHVLIFAVFTVSQQCVELEKCK